MCSCHRRIIYKDIQLLYAEHTTLLNFKSWSVLGGRKMNNCAHLAMRNYTQQNLHFQYCVLHIFEKRLPRNFYSASRNSKILSLRNFSLIGSQNAKKNRETYFRDDLRIIITFLQKFRNMFKSLRKFWKKISYHSRIFCGIF